MEGVVTDLFFESLALQRIDLVARLVTDGRCSVDDQELALEWISELTSSLLCTLDTNSNSGMMLQIQKNSEINS